MTDVREALVQRLTEAVIHAPRSAKPGKSTEYVAHAIHEVLAEGRVQYGPEDGPRPWFPRDAKEARTYLVFNLDPVEKIS
jgi:hypothetical protein